MPPKKGNASKLPPSSSHTVREEIRMQFTRELEQLREDETRTSVTFPSTLTNVERKFLHALAEELGMKSKSTGSKKIEGSRVITVTKPSEDDAKHNADTEIRFNPETVEILKENFSDIGVSLSSSLLNTTSSSGGKGGKDGSSNRKDKFSYYTPVHQELDFLRTSYEKAQLERQQKEGFVKINEKRSLLPAALHKEAVCAMIKEHQIVLVSGETGCGKTTQVPQFLFDDPEIGPATRMVITQPRRLSAMAVSTRISQEREEKLGTTVGYNIHLESEKSKNTQILFITPGVLLRKLQHDALLEEYSLVIIDEAHERDKNTEFLMIILRDICSRRRDLKLILMSATLHTNKISAYFGGIPHIHMGGSCYPVQEFFLEDVLKFTDFVGSRKSTEMTTIEGSSAVLASYIQKSSVYFCPMCQSNQALQSAEEFGTHVATCTGVTATKQCSGKGNKGGGYSRGGADRSSKHKSLDEFVRSLNSGFVEKKAVLSSASVAAPPTPAPTAAAASLANIATSCGAKEDGEEENEDDDYDEDDVDAIVGLSVVSDLNKEDDDDKGAERIVRDYLKAHDDSTIDYDLILELLKYVFSSEYGKEGSVLIFLPGWDDISKLYRIILSMSEYNNKRFKVIQLHSGIPKKAQQEVFQSLSPGEHKIILSTNIAETSITIDDVTVVVDCGRMKEKTYDPYVKLAYLKSTWISQANARQRKGRAGRTRAGVCFHLYSRRRHSNLQEFQDSELLRMSLEDVLLQTKTLGLAPGKGNSPDSLQSFLLKALDPPLVLSITNSIQMLQMIGCLDQDEGITALGNMVAELPLDPRIGKFVLLGCLFGVAPAVVLTACGMGYRDPFIMPTNDYQRKQCNKIKMDLSSGCHSDQMALLKAIEGYQYTYDNLGRKQAEQYCDDKFISRSTMIYLRDLIGSLQQALKDMSIYCNDSKNKCNNDNAHLVMALVGVGLYPDIGVRRQGSKAFTTEKRRKAKIHPASINARTNKYTTASQRSIELMGYQDLVASSSADNPRSASLLMLNTTPVNVLALLLNCGSIDRLGRGSEDDEDNDAEEDADVWEDVEEGEEDDEEISPANQRTIVVEVDGWLKLKIDKEILSLIETARDLMVTGLKAFVDEPNKGLNKAIKIKMEAIIKMIGIEQAILSS